MSDLTPRQDRAHEAVVKLDYFLASIALAIGGYLLTHSPIPRSLLDPGSLLVVAILALLVSCYLALRRIELYSRVMFAQVGMAHCSGRITALAEVLSDTTNLFVLDQLSGEKVDRESATSSLEQLRTTYNRLSDDEDKLIAQCARAFVWRDRTLIAGLAMAFGARLLGAPLT